MSFATPQIKNFVDRHDKRVIVMHIIYKPGFLRDLLHRVPGHSQGFVFQKYIHMNLLEFATLHIESGLGGGSVQSKYGRKSDVEKATH